MQNLVTEFCFTFFAIRRLFDFRFFNRGVNYLSAICALKSCAFHFRVNITASYYYTGKHILFYIIFNPYQKSTPFYLNLYDLSS